MAELAAEVPLRRGARLSISQIGAIAWVRWRLLLNSSRRRGGAAELVGRLLLLPVVLSLLLLPAAFAGFFAWYLAMHGTLQDISLLLWGAFALTQLLNLNLGQPGTTLDPGELTRYPLPVHTYVLVRLCFGLLSPANAAVALMSVAIFVGITLDRPALWPWTLLAMAAFALANILFSRMIFAWIDRWLSTRRSREIFTGFIFFASLGFQYLNVTLNPGFQHGLQQGSRLHEHIHKLQFLSGSLHPWLRWLPPELGGAAVVAAEQGARAWSVVDSGGILLYAGVFLLVYVWRMRVEYRGESLSETANAVRRTHVAPPTARDGRNAVVLLPLQTTAPATRLPSLLQKEFLLLRRNSGLLYGVVAPLVMVFLFSGRLATHGNSQWLLLAAVSYALLGLAPMSYNSFGLEGPGAQLYFYAPIPIRDVFFAKNLMHFLLALVEISAVLLILVYLSGKQPVASVTFVFLWAAATLLFNTALGNLRSLSAPKKVQAGKSPNRAQSQVSVWIAIALLATSTGVAAAFQFTGRALHRPWIALALALAFFLAGLFAYLQGLRGIESYALARRESVLEELGKKG